MSPFWRGNQLVWTQKKELEMRAHDLDNFWHLISNRVIRKSRKTQHQNSEFGHTQGEIQKKPLKKYISIQGAGP